MNKPHTGRKVTLVTLFCHKTDSSAFIFDGHISDDEAIKRIKAIRVARIDGVGILVSFDNEQTDTEWQNAIEEARENGESGWNPFFYSTHTYEGVETVLDI